jgi:cell division protein FtsI (penicillin-binding protein 3)
MSNTGEGLKSTRIALVIIGVTVWSLIILCRLVQVQIFEHRSFARLANEGQQARRSILAPRGIIYDSHMAELATSVTVSTAVAEPRRMKDLSASAQNLAAILEIDPQELLSRMKDPARQSFMIIKRRIDPQAEEHIRSMEIEGVYFVDESMRVYPNRDLASQTLGFVNMNGDGSAGIELEYDKELKGKEGLYSFDIDARRRTWRVKVDQLPVQGHSLVLSIDKSIQYIADRELAAGMEKFRARSGTVIVMESGTGRILALANHPQFNCNTFNKYESKFWRNRAVSDIYEPGSTFKVVVAAAALEAGLTRPDEKIDCQMGSISIGRHVFHDHKSYGLLSFSEILEFSSNVGAVKLGLRLGEQHLYEALRNFGFGSKSGIDLPAESTGLVRDVRDWSGLSIGAISFGQEVGVTSIQILTAINAIANGGYRVRPSIVDRIINEKGDLVDVRTPERVRLMRPQTAEAVSRAFEGVILRGTGRQAALEGYRAAGKTGTAQKITDGQYSKSKYVSSFVGFAPLPDPKISILVQIDEPEGKHYGGDVCAPIFRKIAEEALLQLQIPPDPDLLPPEIPIQIVETSSGDFMPDATPIQPFGALDGNLPRADEPQEVISIRAGGKTIVLPDFQGLSKRIVLNRCMDLGIRLQSSGSGVAVVQSPPPGTRVPSGTVCKVSFAKATLKLHMAAAEALYTAEHDDAILSAGDQP